MGKLKKEKHNHKLTDFLKVGIFSLVMLAPFISIGSKMAYVTFNKNAKDSYSGNTELTYYDKEEIEYPTNDQHLVRGNYYWINNVTLTNLQNYANSEQLDLMFDFLYGEITFNYYEDEIGYILGNSYASIYINGEYGDTDIDMTDIVNEFNYYINAYGMNITFTGIVQSWTDIQFLQYFEPFYYDDYPYLPKYTYEEKTLTQTTLDNVFEYAVNQLGETQIFAWTKNTAIYTPIETMTNGLGFDPDNNTLAILLTYWSLVTAVYVIMDIILFAFTKITHFTQD